MSGSRALVTAKFNTPNNKVQSEFRTRNHVATTFRGPVFVVEDVYVPCALCRTPVDPVTRIPVGAVYFHPRCLRCSLCDAPAGTMPFASVNDQPVCATCNTQGHKPPKLTSSKFGSHATWNEASRQSPAKASRTPIRAADTARAQLLQDRQTALAQHDANIRLLEDKHGDNPSQPTAWINPDGRHGGGGSATKVTPTPSRQLLPAIMSSHRRAR